MSVDPQKYIVFNRAEFLEEDTGVEHLELQDSVVIRLQDIFAAGALYTYANSIRTAIEIMTLHPNTQHYSTQMMTYLNELADYFMEMAAKAETASSKVPD